MDPCYLHGWLFPNGMYAEVNTNHVDVACEVLGLFDGPASDQEDENFINNLLEDGWVRFISHLNHIEIEAHRMDQHTWDNIMDKMMLCIDKRGDSAGPVRISVDAGRYEGTFIFDYAGDMLFVDKVHKLMGWKLK